jgi:hypothetical protein
LPTGKVRFEQRSEELSVSVDDDDRDSIATILELSLAAATT